MKYRSSFGLPPSKIFFNNISCRKSPPTFWNPICVCVSGGGGVRNQSCSECPEIHFDFGIFEIWWNLLVLAIVHKQAITQGLSWKDKWRIVLLFFFLTFWPPFPTFWISFLSVKCMRWNKSKLLRFRDWNMACLSPHFSWIHELLLLLHRAQILFCTLRVPNKSIQVSDNASTQTYSGLWCSELCPYNGSH